MKLSCIKQRKEWKVGETVLLRIDGNVPLDHGHVDPMADFRLQRVKPTIDFLRARHARVVLIAHLGRPETRWHLDNGHSKLIQVLEETLSLEPIADRLSTILGMSVPLVHDPVGSETLVNVIHAYEPGDVMLLENIRYYTGEETNDLNFSRMLASLGAVYVDDGFGVAHRKAASVVGVTQFVDHYAGLLMADEVQKLSEVRDKPAHPYAAIMGGIKISTKLGLLARLLQQADKVLLGGGIASVVLAAMGCRVGGSKIEQGFFHEINTALLQRHTAKLLLPVDVVIHSTKTDEVRVVDVPKCPGHICHEDEEILDIGPRTGKLFARALADCKTIIWNGTVGKAEDPRFRGGSKAVLDAMVANDGMTIIGGGETTAFVREENAEKGISFLSTGGGAMLEFLEGKELPGIEALKK